MGQGEMAQGAAPAHRARWGRIAVQQLGNQSRGFIHVLQQREHLGRRQHHGQAAQPLGLHQLIQPGQINPKNLLVQIQQCGLGQVLGGRRHLPIHRQVAQKRLDLRRAHILGVALAVVDNKAPRPVDIGLLGANAVVPGAQVNAQTLQQPGLAGRRGIAGGSWQLADLRDRSASAKF